MISARIRPDGTVVRREPDGSEMVFPPAPVRPMTDVEVSAAAPADPDARPTTPEGLAGARRLPRIRALCRTLAARPG